VQTLHFASLSKDEAKADGNLSCTLGVSLEGCRVGKSGRNAFGMGWQMRLSF